MTGEEILGLMGFGFVIAMFVVVILQIYGILK